jgi:acyl-CoA synthetase (NDP forming)
MSNQSDGASLARVFAPRTIAIVGASTSLQKAGSQLLNALRDFPGELYPIHPSASEIQGFRAYRRLVDLPSPPDLVAITVPAAATPEVMQQAAAAGAGGALVIGGGFGEAGESGLALEAMTVQAARLGGVRMVGPNSSGFFNPAQGCYATFVPGAETIGPGRVAVVAQSGGVNLTLAFLLAREGLGVSLAVGLGNAPDITASDVLEYLAADDDTRVIGLHLEGVREGRRLYDTIRKLTPRKPVVVLTVGRSDSGAFAQSHTGALLGSFDLKVAALRQAGAVVVDSTDALVDACAALGLARLRPKADPGVGLVTAQAGPGLLVVDNLKAAGVSLPTLADDTLRGIAALLPPITFMSNPVDTGRPSPDFARILALVALDPAVDLVCVSALNEPEVLDAPLVLGQARSTLDKPMLYGGMGAAGTFDAVLAATRAAGVAAFTSPERLVGAAVAMVTDAQAQHRLQATLAQSGTIRSGDAALDGPLDEARAKSLIETYGFHCPERVVCESRITAREAFQKLAKPIVAKVLDATIQHKTEAGGVHLNIDTLEVLERALDRIDAIPGPKGQRRYLLEAMAPSGLEMIIGAVRDPSFGPVILVGLGGTVAEALQDVSQRLAPIAREDAEAMLDELRGRALLGYWRGRPPLDREALVAALLAMSELIVGHPELKEAEINPLRLYLEGALALDALMICEAAAS